MFELSQKSKNGLCRVKYCRKQGVPKKGHLCHKHYQQKWRAENPELSAYRTLKDHALHRKIPFKMSFDYFRGLCDGLNYFDREAETKGETSTIDRVEAHKGYVEGNLRIISHSENVIKGNKERYLPEHIRDMLRRKQEQETNEEDDDNCPF